MLFPDNRGKASTAEGAENLRRITEFFKKNPKATRKECMAALGLSLSTVQRHANAAGVGNNHGALQREVGEHNKRVIASFYRNNPTATRAECAASIGLALRSVCNHIADMKRNGIPDEAA